jgi:uridine kinase
LHQQQPKVTLIGLSGGSGSGKTTLVKRLTKALDGEDILVIQMDHYYLDLSHLSIEERDLKNFDHPDALDLELLVLHLKDLKTGKSIERPHYDFPSHTRSLEKTILKPSRVILVDGILSLHHPEMRRLFDLTIYVDVDDDLRFIRRLQRDIVERGRTMQSVIQQYLTSVKTMHDTFVEPQKYLADIIISWRDDNKRAVQMLKEMVRGLLNNEKKDPL